MEGALSRQNRTTAMPKRGKRPHLHVTGATQCASKIYIPVSKQWLGLNQRHALHDAPAVIVRDGGRLATWSRRLGHQPRIPI
jgi:hypothetical protein